MQYSCGANASLPVLADVARHVRGHFGVMLNRSAARRLGIADGDLVEIESPTGRTEGRAVLLEGVRPDVVVMLQQFGHWATPFARDLGAPNLNQVASMNLALTDATGSGADVVPVAIRPAPARRGDEERADAGFRAPVPLRPLRTELEICEMYMRGL
jgi:phenylacetyl-CoA:acceptor oxidoreductase